MAKKESPPKAEEFEVDLDADAWAAEEAGAPGLVSRLSAEFIGTFVFMFVGLGATLFGLLLSVTNAVGDLPTDVPSIAQQYAQPNYATALTSALVWGVTLLALFVAFSRVSGAHFNPAITLGAWIAGRFPSRDVASYIIVQTAGAISGAGLVAWLAKGFPLLDQTNDLLIGTGLSAPDVREVMSLVAIGHGDHSPAGVSLRYGLVVEFVAVALLVGIVLAATSIRAPRGQAAVSIGLGFGVLILVTYPFTGGGLNPARVTATALISRAADGGFWGLGDLAWWWGAMLMAGAFVGLLVRAFGPEEDLEVVEIIEVDET